MPKPPSLLLGAVTRINSRELIIPRTPAPAQLFSTRNDNQQRPELTLKTKVVLWIAELPTRFPYNRIASRLLDRAVIAAEKGRDAE